MTSLTESPRIPDLVTAGLSKTELSKPKLDRSPPSFWRSTRARVVLLIVAFAAFPVAVYQQFRPADTWWMAPEIQLVALAYAALAAVVFVVVLGIGANLRRLGLMARSVRIGVPAAPSLVSLNQVPELVPIATEFDRMVSSLRSTAEEGRVTADETAHAFKTPIATISHALTPLRSAVAFDNARARRSIELIEQAAARLDALVVAARRMEQARCRVLHPSCWRLDLGSFIRDAVASKLAVLGLPELRLEVEADSGIYIHGNDDVLEMIVDSVIDNAVSACAPAGRIVICVRQRDGEAVCYVKDEGPGLPVEVIDRAFDPYTFYQPASIEADADEGGDGRPAHFGTGLWGVRRNVEALGGKVWAENRANGGLRIVMTLPLAR